MRLFTKSIIAKFIIAAISISSVSPSFAAVSLVTSLQLDGSSLSSTGWVFGSQSGGSIALSTDLSKTLSGSPGSVVASYPTAVGGVYAWGAYDISALKTNDVYIDFWAKMPNAKQGLKFLKIFGGNSGTSNNYANTTFALDYTGKDMGSMYQVSFGDGTGTGNDTSNAINFDGTYPSWIGRSYGTANVLTPQKKAWASSNWGTGWHHFRIHAKFNTGTTLQTQVADGEYYVEIDGVVFVDAKGLYNRHYSNAPIDRIELFGWAQNGSTPFQIWYDDVKITTGGFAGSSSPAPTAVPPSPPALKVTQQ